MTPPFLSVVTRTQGRRPHTLAQTLASLAAQTDRDFELLLIAHRVDQTALPALERGLPPERSRLIVVEHGNRTAPLNAGFDAARGEYVAILDDDDIALPNWIATFRRLATQAPGRMLRAATRQQRVAEQHVDGATRIVSIGEPEAEFPDDFDVFAHLSANRTPPVALAFPLARLRELALRFDETLTTTEDWDFILRCAGPLGVATTSEVTSIYRYWEQGECSRTVHSDAEWQGNYAAISAKWDAAPFVLPPGSFLRLRQMHDDLHAARLDNATLRDRLATLEAAAAEIPTLRRRLEDTLASRSWRMTAPLRWLSRIR